MHSAFLFTLAVASLATVSSSPVLSGSKKSVPAPTAGPAEAVSLTTRPNFQKLSAGMHCHCLSYQLVSGTHGALEVKIAKEGDVAGVDLLNALASAQKEVDENKRVSSIWVFIPESISSIWAFIPESKLADTPGLMSAALDSGLKFWGKVGDDHRYYKWVSEAEDMVPPHASSITGATAILLSRDQEHMLFVREVGGRNKRSLAWSTVTGAGDLKENCFDTLVREAKEEVGLGVMTDRPVFYVGGYSMANARDGGVNDQFSVLVATVDAVPGDETLQESEIKDSLWVSVEELRAIVNDKSLQSRPDAANLDLIQIEVGGKNWLFFDATLDQIKTYLDGRASPVNMGNWGRVSW
jgi:8-oxo-dGTP pyrophosphatase MutT (NUDIX family)